VGAIVLVVEDDPALRRLLGYILETNGLTPVLLGNAEDALERLPDEHPDVIICDVNLPGMQGTEFVEILRSGDLAATPVVLMSAYGEPEQHSADMYVGKPFEPFELAQLVERLSSS
jgi:two-component system phosphate regulon response regulator PhoB